MSEHSFGGYDKNASNQSAGSIETNEKPVSRVTVYDKLRGELSKPAVVEKFKIISAGKSRPGWSLKISTDLDLEKLDRWRVSARKQKGKEALDMQRYNSLAIASQTICLINDGNEFVDDDGNELGFTSHEVIDILGGLGDVHNAIKNFFVRDAEILKVGSEILEACGYLESEDEDEDPLDSSLD